MFRPIRVSLKVKLKPEVLDVQGRAIQAVLSGDKRFGLRSVQVGKYFEFELVTDCIGSERLALVEEFISSNLISELSETYEILQIIEISL